MFRPALAFALALAAVAPAFAQDGKATYDLQCKLCHDDETLGPSLVGVEGRKVAGGAYDYSPELKAKGEAGETWTDANLDAFLKNPSAYAPGTKMSMSVTDDAARAAVIAYIKSLK
jgi:cytochrome c